MPPMPHTTQYLCWIHGLQSKLVANYHQLRPLATTAQLQCDRRSNSRPHPSSVAANLRVLCQCHLTWDMQESTNDTMFANLLGAPHNSPRTLLSIGNEAGDGTKIDEATFGSSKGYCHHRNGGSHGGLRNGVIGGIVSQLPPDGESGAVHLDHNGIASSTCISTCNKPPMINGIGDGVQDCRDCEANNSGALVCFSERPWALAELDATPPDAKQVLVRRTVLEERRAAAERHHYRDVWVKDPHGGPYRKAVPTHGRTSRTGPLAVTAEPQRPTHPGYEVVEVGPTTNFVGNAMSTSAVDLVMAQLEQLRCRWSPPSSSSHHSLKGSTCGLVASPALPAPLPLAVPDPDSTGSCDAAAPAAATTVTSTATVRHTTKGHSGFGDNGIAHSAPEPLATAPYDSCSAVWDFPGGTEGRQVGTGIIGPAAGCSTAAETGTGLVTGSKAVSGTSGTVDPRGNDRLGSNSLCRRFMVESEEVRLASLRRQARRLMGRMQGD